MLESVARDRMLNCWSLYGQSFRFAPSNLGSTSRLPSNSETHVQPYAKGSRVKTMSELRSKDTLRQISGMRRLGQNGSHTGSHVSLASRLPLGPMIHHPGGIGAILDNSHFLVIFSEILDRAWGL